MSQTVEQKRPRGRPALDEHARERVLEAGRALMREGGLSAMKARSIAQKSGLSVGSVYKLFGEIEDLIQAINLETYADFAAHHQAAKEAAIARGDSVMRRLMALADAYVNFVRDNNHRWLALLAFNRERNAPTEGRYREIEDELFDIVDTIMVELPGLSDPSVRAETTRALWAAVHGITIITLPNSAWDDPVAHTLSQIECIVGAVVRDSGGQTD